MVNESIYINPGNFIFWFLKYLIDTIFLGVYNMQ